MTGKLAVQLNEVSRTYGDCEALSAVNLAIEEGEFVAITGPSDSGKSTLLNILGLLDRSSAGAYRLFGRDTARLRGAQRDWHRGAHLGFVFQESHILPDWDVVENVALGLRCQSVPASHRLDRARDALELVGLGHKAEIRAKLLSGGERQRIAIARALVHEPRLILADEATGSLDRDNADSVMGLLEGLHRVGTTVIVVTHDMDVAKRAGRCISLEAGILRSDVRVSTDAGRVVADAAPWSRPIRARLSDTANDAAKGLWARPLRSALLVVAFVLGIVGLLASTGVASTTAAQVQGRLTAASMDQLSVRPGLPPELTDRISTAVAAIKGLDHVRSVGAKIAVQGADVSVTRLAGGEKADVSLMGGDAGYVELATGDLKPRHSAQLLGRSDSPAAVVSHEAARVLGLPVGPGGVGQGAVIYLNGRPVPVIGLFSPSDRAPDATRAVIVSPSLVRDLGGSEVELVVVTDPGYPAVLARAIPQVVSPANPAEVRAETVADLQGLRVGVADDLSTLVALVGLVVLVVAVLGASVAQNLAVEARSAEIALRRALGSSRRTIAATFLCEGLLVGSLSGAAAPLLAVAAVVGVSVAKGWSPVVPEWSWVQGLVIGVITGLASSAYPAWRASRKEPALGMRD